MRKTFIFLLFLFSCAFSHAQITDKEKNEAAKTRQPGDLKQLQSPYRALDSSRIRTGILYDNIIPFSHIDDYSGAKKSKAASKEVLEQVYLELASASVTKKKWKSFNHLEAAYRANEKVIPLSILHFQYNKIKPDALARGLLLKKDGKIIPGSTTSETPYLIKQAFVAAPLRAYTFRGSNVTFRLNTDLYLTNLHEKPAQVKIDFGDNQGFREVAFDQDILVHYAATGSRTISVEITTGDQAVLHSSFTFKVRALTSPDHVDFEITAKIPYQGVVASGTAYLYLSPLNTRVTNPIVVVEGLDIDNSWYADTLYATFNQQNLADNLRQQGYDIILINFTDATTYIQANAFMLAEWIDYLNTSLKAGDQPNVVVGASMGGVVARYALRYMETNNRAHQTGLFVAFDSPQQGANIPLGDQFLIKYFAVNRVAPNAQARENLDGLNAIAARQLLVYHHLAQPDGLSVPLPDTLRLNFVSALTALGYPRACRNIAISNGAADGTGQPFQPGDQFIKYYYKSFWVDIDARSHAVPHPGPATIAYLWLNPWDLFGLVHYKFEKKVEGTAPYDNAPGSTRPTHQQIAQADVSYGDIEALIRDHCFIPTTSSLDVKTAEASGAEPYYTGLLNQNLFYNIQNDPDILRKTPFHAIYYPTAPGPEFPQVHQLHLAITSETVGWMMQELNMLTTPPAGLISRERWWDVPGTALRDIPAEVSAAVTDLLTSLEVPPNQSDDYAERIRGYLHPLQTGAYTFWIASDHASEVYLSTDDRPENKLRLAFLHEPVDEREWNRYESQQSAPVPLQAGRKYYLEVLHKEGAGEDHLAVGWRTPSMAAEALPAVVPGAVLSPYQSPAASARLAEAGVAAAEKPARAEKNMWLQVYPNPASNTATVALTPPESGLLLIQVFDLQGRLHQQVFGDPVKAGFFYKRVLDTAALASGVYLVRLVNGKRFQHVRLLISH